MKKGFSDLKGCTITEIDGGLGDDALILTLSDGRTVTLSHNQSCCESVDIEDIAGNLEDLMDTPILDASEESNSENPPGVPIPEYQESFTWTFYRLTTIRGTVVIRWYGSSNGYYSESVDVAWSDDPNSMRYR